MQKGRTSKKTERLDADVEDKGNLPPDIDENNPASEDARRPFPMQLH